MLLSFLMCMGAGLLATCAELAVGCAGTAAACGAAATGGVAAASGVATGCAETAGSVESTTTYPEIETQPKASKQIPTMNNSLRVFPVGLALQMIPPIWEKD